MSLPELIAHLLDPCAYPHAVHEIRLIETHISWVLIAGDFAYKIKKPLNLGFLDFSSLDKRRHFCEEEVRLNRRLAPQIYLDTVAITGSESAPKIAGDGPVLDWAVRMRAFPADSTLDQAHRISATQIDAIADAVARFHRDLPPATRDSPFGEPAAALQPALENFAQIRALGPSPEMQTLLDHLEAWTRTEGHGLAAAFSERKRLGFIRECHGDLHLGNIAWVADAPLIFDCIEFNPALRWIDVLSELAFLFMDLIHREHAPLAWRLLNRYLEHTGDYAGLPVFRFYLVYRAMVRAKVAAIRAHQGEIGAAGEIGGYLRLAATLSQGAQAKLLLMHGVSGSGKTWLSQQVLEQLGAVRLRSDVERKRLFGLGALETSRHIEGGIYTEAASVQTFQHLHDLARGLLRAGYPVIVDATFLKQAHRAPFAQLAAAMDVPLHILALQADEALLRQRLHARSAGGGDASEAGIAVLDMQLQAIDPFTEHEMACLSRFQADDLKHWPRSIERLVRAGKQPH